MGTVRERTQREIEEYIRTHSKDGKLTESLLDIAEKIGYSNATVHRALKALQSKGLISIEDAKKPTEPNTIVFKGDVNQVDTFLSKGVHMVSDLKEQITDLEEHLRRANWLIRQLHEENQKLKSKQGEVVNVSHLDGTDLELVTLRRKVENNSCDEAQEVETETASAT